MRAEFEGMRPGDVLRVLDALDAAGIATHLEGGWGVDALAGRWTRAHRDVDVTTDATHEAGALRVLEALGYVVETDWRPTRVELAAAGRGWVDLHPLRFAPDGSATLPGIDGEVYEFPTRYFTTGSISGRAVGCFTIEAQRFFRTGYVLRPVDEHDLSVLDELEVLALGMPR